MAENNVGHFEGSRMTGRYWVGGCTCGSGKEGHEVHDGNGIYCGIGCSVCKREEKYRPEIMNRAYDQTDVDEPIDEE
jgi:hypothetical protein